MRNEWVAVGSKLLWDAARITRSTYKITSSRFLEKAVVIEILEASRYMSI